MVALPWQFCEYLNVRVHSGHKYAAITRHIISRWHNSEIVGTAPDFRQSFERSLRPRWTISAHRGNQVPCSVAKITLVLIFLSKHASCCAAFFCTFLSFVSKSIALYTQYYHTQERRERERKREREGKREKEEREREERKRERKILHQYTPSPLNAGITRGVQW